MLPFQDYDLTDFDLDVNCSNVEKPSRTKRIKKVKTEKIVSPPTTIPNEKVDFAKSYYLYIENSDDLSDLLTFEFYAGPCNTLHLNKQLSLPQLLKTKSTSGNSHERFLNDFDRVSSTMTSTSNSSISIYIRFGIMYLIQGSNYRPETLSIREFIDINNRDKRIKTSFYSSKGVSSPKNLLKTVIRQGFSRSSLNTYSYDVQFFVQKKDQSNTFHLRYDEHLRCYEIIHRTTSPINFDFIRDKSSSAFRSIDDSYADMFDFRIQIQQTQKLTKDDPTVLSVLQGVPIDEVLYMDEKNFNLHVATILRQSVKYMKCIRSSKYIIPDASIAISIGSYEEFRLNQQGICESTMKSENTMTIELIDVQTIPTAEKLYDLGMWFSSLCQTSVDQPTNNSTAGLNHRTRSRWFSQVFDAWKKNRTVKKRRIDELTRYTTQKSNQYYTNEDLAFVKHIIYTNDWLNFVPPHRPDQLSEEFNKLIKRLKSIQIPLAVEAQKRVENKYLSLKENNQENKL